MTREELIQALAARINVSPTSAHVFLHAYFDIIKSMLRGGEEVSLPDIGAWTPTIESDGRLSSVRYAAFTPVSAEVPEDEAVPADLMDGPASSIDTRHFIPATALNGKEVKLPATIDVAALVAEVRASFAPASSDPDSSVPDSSALDSSAESDPSSETSTIEGVRETDEASTIEDEVFSDETDAIEDTYLTDETAELEETEEDLLLEAEMEAEGYEDLAEKTVQTPSEEDYSRNDAEKSDSAEEQDPLSDDEVFNRNRNQLYYPPKEPSKRPLLITAAVLTFCVVVIIIYLLLDKNEPRELPGSEPVGCLVERPRPSSHGDFRGSSETRQKTFSIYRSIR